MPSLFMVAHETKLNEHIEEEQDRSNDSYSKCGAFHSVCSLVTDVGVDHIRIGSSTAQRRADYAIATTVAFCSITIGPSEVDESSGECKVEEDCNEGEECNAA